MWGEKKVIKIDGIIIVDKIVYPIEKVQNTTKSNRKTLRCVLKLMWQSSINNHKIFLPFEIHVVCCHTLYPFFISRTHLAFVSAANSPIWFHKFNSIVLISTLAMSKKNIYLYIERENNIVNKNHLINTYIEKTFLFILNCL